MHSFGFAVIATLYFILQVGAQIPKPCEENYNPNNLGECCPELVVNKQSMGSCGSAAKRGKCVEVSQLCNTAYNTSSVTDQHNACKNIDDERLNWPSQLFSHVCVCEEKYGDYDCGRCAYGYTENSEFECISDPHPRRSITSLNDKEWEEYLALLSMAKNTISDRYVVITGKGDNSTRPISTYNLFVWFHHYAAKDHLTLTGYSDANSGM